MQFKHPELLYALFLLVIPIIVHLFQLRKFQKEAFTNVAFLKKVTLQTRKSSQIKKWLTLLTRLLLLAAIIVAFAQPYKSKSEHFSAKNQTVIYLDNSFSMQAKGPAGELLKRAVQDIINAIDEDEEISIITNNGTYKNSTLKTIKNDLLQLEYSPNQLTYNSALLKAKQLFKNSNNGLKNLVFISDFQQQSEPFTLENDSIINYQLVKLSPVNINNIYIDSIYVSKNTPSNFKISVNLKNNGNRIDNLPISLFDGNNLLAKASVSIDKATSTNFLLPVNTAINGKITIDDASLQFDNELFFSVNPIEKINVLTISVSEDGFLNNIFTNDEFNFTSTSLEQLNYNSIDSQNLIVLNELENIPASLVSVLTSFTDNGGFIVVIPSEEINLQAYNNFLINYNNGILLEKIDNEKRITTINYSHPLYNNGVFEKQVSNFQYPKVNSYYNVNATNLSNILLYEDGKPFLYQSSEIFVFSSPLNNENSNFKKSPLIVPTLYNIGMLSLKTPRLYYTIGNENTYDVNVQLQQDHILSLASETENIIPQQQYFNNKIAITTMDMPDKSGIYSVTDQGQALMYVSYNYNRDESNLVYENLPAKNNSVTISNSIINVFDTLKSDLKVNELWKWFVIFALLFLIIEMLILKYLK
ncbi:BatA and WFA domain-containing protein [Yeosuana sp. MJ-SS3]|uniref:BatA and WFA domain-containing protein n=1 Tax=Gilvirhabdus luticola TaxID=3079858 RepID=A0ABU3UAC9_9FLAO|nr:BatA and WFA domain-containing protein [Yeosuana sp. MJ-SS3]MDU8887294.1 BatA and WFA domain-containing protein [Yeosuana sp. MJ-SS3]